MTKNWIPKNLKKGRCTPMGTSDCPVGSPQYNLAKTFKKHHGFHADGGKLKSNMVAEVTVTAPALVKQTENPFFNIKPLWATEYKSNPNTIVGTLDPLDRNFDRGITLKEAMDILPKYTRDEYNMDAFYKPNNSTDNKYNGGELYFLGGDVSSGTTSSLLDQAVPGAGTAISLVNSAGDSIGGSIGAAVSGSVNPLAATFNKELKPWQRIVGTINPALGGVFNYNQQKESAALEEQNNDIIQRNNLFGIKAAGGMLNINPSEKSLTEFNNGGSHETSPLNGVPQGISPNGEPNLVEEGETKWQDYIFSDRLSLNDNLINKYNLPKSMNNKTFAAVSKKANKIAKERPNDPISKSTTESYMNTLMMANDDARAVDEYNQFAKGGRILMAAGASPNMMMEYAKGGRVIMPMGVSPNMGTMYPDGGGLFNPRELGMSEIEPLMFKTANNSLTDNPKYADWRGIAKDPVSSVADISKNLEVDKLKSFGEGQVAKANALSPTKGLDLTAKALRYAPIAFNAIAGLTHKDTPKITPTLMDIPERLVAPQYDVEPARRNIEAGFQTGINSLAGATGGSGAAMRAGLLGLGDDYMGALGQAYLGAEERNKAGKFAADQENIQNRMRVGAVNRGAIDEANRYNSMLGVQDRDTRLSYLGKAFEGLGDVGYEQRMMEIMPRIYGYNDQGQYINPSTGKRVKACGGKLKCYGGKLKK